MNQMRPSQTESVLLTLLLHVQTAFQSEQLLQDTLVLLLLGYSGSLQLKTEF